MYRTILHIDFNSYFATVEQQANPRLRGKPIGVTGGDRMKRTVIGAASVEAKKFGVKTGMQIWEAKKLCPQIILVQGDSDKYLACTTRFLNIIKDYSPNVEIFSIDEVFMELPTSLSSWSEVKRSDRIYDTKILSTFGLQNDILGIAREIKSRIRAEIGEWITCSIGVSYNKLMAKLAGSLQKPDGLVVIENEKEAMQVLDQVPLDEICGIGPRIKSRLNKIGIFNFKQLRAVPPNILLLEFKNNGQFLYDGARGINHNPIIPFYEKEEVKSVGHRHTIDHDSDSAVEIKQILLKLTELVARRLRAKKLVGRTISCWFRYGTKYDEHFTGGGMQVTIPDTDDGLEIFKAGWKIFHQIWDGKKIRMIGVSVSNLKPLTPQNLSFLEDHLRQEKITKALDKINDRYGEFTLQRGVLLDSEKIRRKPNSFLSDRRFKL